MKSSVECKKCLEKTRNHGLRMLLDSKPNRRFSFRVAQCLRRYVTKVGEAAAKAGFAKYVSDAKTQLFLKAIGSQAAEVAVPGLRFLSVVQRPLRCAGGDCACRERRRWDEFHHRICTEAPLTAPNTP